MELGESLVYQGGTYTELSSELAAATQTSYGNHLKNVANIRDNNTGTWSYFDWDDADNENAWVQWDFGSDISVGKVVLYARDNWDRQPVIIEYSDDGTTWTEAGRWTTTVTGGPTSKGDLIFPSTTARFWRVIENYGGAAEWRLYEIKFYSVDEQWSNQPPSLLSGSGSPESSVTASPGALYVDTDGGASTTLYVKESGTGNTGWVAK